MLSLIRKSYMEPASKENLHETILTILVILNILVHRMNLQITLARKQDDKTII